MNWQSVQNRLNEIFQVDVMADEEWDFMATHMPFNSLSVQFSGRKSSPIEQMSEEETYRELIKNPNNEHQMIIVRGPNGAGKSHLIRWLRARMQSDSHNEDIQKEKVVFIRRIDNTLRGTMRQLLEQGVVTDPAQRERISKFIQSSTIQNEAELKSTLYYSFLTKVETEQEETEYRSAERKRLATFLRDDDVKDFLMREEGPVSRFYELIAKPHGVTHQIEATFRPDDFTAMRGIMTIVKRNGNQDTNQMLGRVVNISREAEKLAVYLNRFSSAVIQQCANIAQGDVDDMIRQLRLDLKREGKTLTVLIEDITTFTGIDSEIIKVLSVPHTGAYKDLCRVTSVIGITDAYYDTHFKDNFQNRVTHQISLDPGNFGDERTLGQMAVRYINAAYMTMEEATEWYRQGSDFDSLPYRTWVPNFEWESEKIGGRDFSLFPFNRRSLVKLFARLPEKTPRFFLRDVIKTQMNAWIEYQLEEVEAFPDTRANAIGEDPIQFQENQHAARFETIELSKEKKQRLRTMLCFWGDAHLREAGEGTNRTIGNLSVSFLSFFGFDDLSGVRQTGSPTSTTTTSEVVSGTTTQRAKPVEGNTIVNKDYNDQLQALINWYENKSILAFPEDFRTRVRLFLADSINWQLEGVPAYLAGAKLTTRNIYIEDQQGRRDVGDKAIVTIKREANSYWMLVALTHWYHNGRSWDFKDAAFMQFRLITWLEANKTNMIASIKGEPNASPIQTLQWTMALEYLRLGTTGGLAYTDKDETLLKKLFVRESQTGSPRPDTGDAWSRLLKYVQSDVRKIQFDENQKALVRLPNTHMGSVTADRDSKFLFHRDEIDQAFRTLKKLDWDIATLLPEEPIEREEISTSAARLLQTLLPRVKEVLQDEKRKANELLEKLNAKLGKTLDRETWVEASREMVGFLNTLNNQYRINFQPSLRIRAEKLEETATELARICKRALEVTKGEKFSQELTYFSTNPCQLMQDALEIIEAIEELATKEARIAENALASLRQNTGSNKEMLDLIQTGLNSLIDQIEALGRDNNVNQCP